MIVTRLKLKNWCNFIDVDVALRERTYLLGANASGKSNLLNVFRFLRDVAKTQGGGLQKALFDRGRKTTGGRSFWAGISRPYRKVPIPAACQRLGKL